MKIVIASGYFDPIRDSHIEYLNLAKSIGDKLVVIVNNDKQVLLKKSIPFMDVSNRYYIVSNLKCVDGAIISIDEDKTVCKSIEMIHQTTEYNCNGENHSYIFAKGGDRLASEIPESEVCNRLGIKIVDGLGEKKGSSSELLSEYVKKSNEIGLLFHFVDYEKQNPERFT